MQFLGYALIAIIVAALLFYAMLAVLPQGLTLAPERDQPPRPLPGDRLVTSEDLVAVRLPVVLRGYRMTDTDDLIDRLTLEIAVRDRELAQLRGGQPPGPQSFEAQSFEAQSFEAQSFEAQSFEAQSVEPAPVRAEPAETDD